MFSDGPYVFSVFHGLGVPSCTLDYKYRKKILLHLAPSWYLEVHVHRAAARLEHSWYEVLIHVAVEYHSITLVCFSCIRGQSVSTFASAYPTTARTW